MFVALATTHAVSRTTAGGVLLARRLLLPSLSSQPSLHLSLASLRLGSHRHLAVGYNRQQKKPRRKDKQHHPSKILAEKLKREEARREKKRRQARAKSIAAMHRESTDAEHADLDASNGASSMPLATEKHHTNDKVPPAMLLRTGSQFAFVSRSAAIQAGLNPLDMFSPADVQQRPSLFRHCTFIYDGLVEPNKDKHHSRPDENAPDDSYEQRATQAKQKRPHAPQVAFLGRSNVGKSSLVNALMKKELARCSKQPGRTQQVHRFALVDPSKDASTKSHLGAFLDLPGYGFAVAPGAALDNWQRLTQAVLRQEYDAGHLKRIFILIDARHGITPIDETVLQWLEGPFGQIPYTLVWTKTDAVQLPQLIKKLNEAFFWYEYRLHVAKQDDHTEACLMSPVIYTTSTKGGGMGLHELLSAIEVDFHQPAGQ